MKKRPPVNLKKTNPKAYHDAMAEYYDNLQFRHENKAKRAQKLYDKHWGASYDASKKKKN